MIAEYRMLRFSAELHPLVLLQDALPTGTVSSDRLTHLRQGSMVHVVGLVTTRQRPGTAKGYVFVLMEDAHGPMNVIVKPDVYERNSSAVRMEPFLAVRGRLQKDGATLNIVAHQVETLRVPGMPIHVRRPSHSYDTTNKSQNELTDISENLNDFSELQTSLPDTMDYWTDPGRSAPSPFHYLTALRQSPPGIKSFV